MASLLGRKIGMTQYFTDEGVVEPVTVIQAGPCFVIQKKTMEKDGYTAIQIGFEDLKPNRTKAPIAGHHKASDVKPKRVLREVRVDEAEIDSFELGQEIGASIFKEGDIVDVVGTSKGRGYTGVMKRHGFHGMKATHGTHEFFRHGGAIGQHSYPGEVFKGMKMPGQFGNSRITVKNLTVKKVDAEKNILFISGAVPGHRKGLVRVNTAKTGMPSEKTA